MWAVNDHWFEETSQGICSILCALIWKLNNRCCSIIWYTFSLINCRCGWIQSFWWLSFTGLLIRLRVNESRPTLLLTSINRISLPSFFHILFSTLIRFFFIYNSNANKTNNHCLTDKDICNNIFRIINKSLNRNCSASLTLFLSLYHCILMKALWNGL